MELHRQPGCWLRSSHTFKECVIAHWSSDSAPKIIGAQAYHRSFGIAKAVGRGALYKGRSGIERNRGLYTRENAGISSARQARNLPVESLRFPGEGSSAQGKSGPKPRTESRRRWRAGGDSCTAKGALNEAVTQEDRPSGVMVNPVQGARVERSEVRVPRA